MVAMRNRLKHQSRTMEYKDKFPEQILRDCSYFCLINWTKLLIFDIFER